MASGFSSCWPALASLLLTWGWDSSTYAMAPGRLGGHAGCPCCSEHTCVLSMERVLSSLTPWAVLLRSLSVCPRSVAFYRRLAPRSLRRVPRSHLLLGRGLGGGSEVLDEAHVLPRELFWGWAKTGPIISQGKHEANTRVSFSF